MVDIKVKLQPPGRGSTVAINGVEIQGITRIDIWQDACGLPYARLEVVGSTIELEGLGVLVEAERQDCGVVQAPAESS